MVVEQRTATMLNINGKDFMVWTEYSESQEKGDESLTIMDVPIHVTFTVREAYASDYIAEKVQPSGEQVITGGF